MTRKTPIDSWDEVPDFACEDDEVAWWNSHEFSERFLADAVARERERRARGEAGDRPADRIAAARGEPGPAAG